ncbi:MAG TPA: outer membrane beta-barrel protein [Flavisolibacter sp.]|nr:outer membrane beta-barrel protein [Flavisolibacter sp.]
MRNEFEKQVKQKMEELDFVPSEPVWDKVASQIKQKRERRRLIFWLPVSALLLAGGLWLAYTAGESKGRSARIKETGVNETLLRKQPAADVQPAQAHAQASQGQPSLSTAFPEASMAGSSADAENINSYSSITNTKQQSAAAGLYNPRVQPAGTRARISFEVQEAAIGRKTEDPAVGRSLENSTGSVPVLGKDPAADKKGKAIADSVAKANTQTGPDPKPDSAVVKTDQPLNKKKSQKPSWQFGVYTSAGISGYANRLSLFGGSQEKAMLASPSNAALSPIFAGVYGREPSEEKNDWGFTAGFTARRTLGKRFGLSAGLQYSYYSHIIEVGRKVSQNVVLANSISVDRFYTNFGNEYYDFQNRFHFVSIPMGADFQVLSKLPLRVHAGLAVQKLVKTNALEYNAQSNVYYHNDGAFNKLQTMTDLGLSYTIPVKRFSLSAGPQMQYGLSSLKKGDAASHLFYLGMKAQLLFQKRK